MQSSCVENFLSLFVTKIRELFNFNTEHFKNTSYSLELRKSNEMYDCTKCNFKFVSCEACMLVFSQCCVLFFALLLLPFHVIAQASDTISVEFFPFVSCAVSVVFFACCMCADVNPRCSLLRRLTTTTTSDMESGEENNQGTLLLLILLLQRACRLC